MNSACNLKLPVLFLVEDNGYAISVPVEVQTAGRQRRDPGEELPQSVLGRRKINGNDPVESYGVLKGGDRSLPRPQGSGVRARSGDAALLALDVGR